MELTKELLIENVFKKYKDPELDIDVWTLGLIYEVKSRRQACENSADFHFAAMPVPAADGG